MPFTSILTLVEKERLQYKLSKVGDLEEELSFVKFNLFENFSSFESALPIDTKLTLWNREVSGLALLTRQGPVCVLRFSERQCQTCVELEMEQLNILADEIGMSRIALWGDFTSPNSPKIFKQVHGVELDLYRVPLNSLPFSFESLGRPYYFILHPNGRASSFFIPDKYQQHLSHEYLEQIKKILIKNSLLPS